MNPASQPEQVGDPSTRSQANAWGRWWVRVPLWIIHVSLLVAALLLTPEGYHTKLGYNTGLVYFLGTVFLWLLLYFARTKALVALFCGLMLAQFAFMALFVFQYRAEDRALRALTSEALSREKDREAQVEAFHISRLFEMLAPGNEFHPEELPGLLDRTRAVRAKAKEFQSQQDEWVRGAEKRLAAISNEGAAEFHRGVEDSKRRNQEVQGMSEQYFAEIENLTGFLIERRGRYTFSNSGVVFRRQEDARQYNQMLERLRELEQKMKAFRDEQQQELKGLLHEGPPAAQAH